MTKPNQEAGFFILAYQVQIILLPLAGAFFVEIERRHHQVFCYIGRFGKSPGLCGIQINKTGEIISGE
jgi:hypothetical protein